MFGVSEVDSVHRQNGIPHEQLIALLRRQIGVNLTYEDGHSMLLSPRDRYAQSLSGFSPQFHYSNVTDAPPLSIYSLKCEKNRRGEIMQCKWLKHGHNLQSMFHVRELTHLNDQRLIERDKFKGREKAIQKTDSFCASYCLYVNYLKKMLGIDFKSAVLNSYYQMIN